MTAWGYAGSVLRVDLNRARVHTEPLPQEMIERYLGGAGFCARYLFERMPADTGWDHPDNPLVLAAGPFGNTPLHGSGTLCFGTKGPMTDLAVMTQANGYAGAWLKSCGYDVVVIQGQASDLAYLLITEAVVAIRPAGHLQGEDTLACQEALKAQLGRQKGISVYCIGPAGENRVRYSAVVGDGTHVASKGGVGAVMGAKRLKAVVFCRGKGKPAIHDRPLLVSIAKELHVDATVTYLDGSRHKWGTNGSFSNLLAVGALPVRNYTTNLFPQHAKMNGQYVRGHFPAIRRKTCFNCGINHIYDRRVAEGPFKDLVAEEPEYEAFASFGPQIGQTDAGAVFYLTDLADRLGIDLSETGWVLGWAMECVAKGILTAADFDGIELAWGKVDAAAALMKRIATRKGVGDLLAEGVRRAAVTVGGEALHMAVCTQKGATPRSHDHRARWPELVDTCLTNTSTLEATFVGVRPHLLDMPPVHDPFSPWEVPVVNAHQNGWAMIEDCLGACRFNLTRPEAVARALQALTGEDRSIPDLLTIGRRIVNLLRLFNLDNGLTPRMEAPSARYGSAPVDGPAQGKRILDHWPLIRELYYRHMGWDPETGAPTAETLAALGLESDRPPK